MKKMNILYILQNGNTNQYKIGITKDLNMRLHNLQTGCPGELRVIKIWQHYDRKVIEKYERVLHNYQPPQIAALSASDQTDNFQKNCYILY